MRCRLRVLCSTRRVLNESSERKKEKRDEDRVEKVDVEKS